MHTNARTHASPHAHKSTTGCVRTACVECHAQVLVAKVSHCIHSTVVRADCVVERRTSDFPGFETTNRPISFTSHCPCLSEETLKVVFIFYLAFMPEEVKDPIGKLKISLTVFISDKNKSKADSPQFGPSPATDFEMLMRSGEYPVCCYANDQRLYVAIKWKICSNT